MRFRPQHYHLLTLISKAYANILTWKNLETPYKDMIKSQAHGDHSAISHNHILLCSLKAWATENASIGAKNARKMSGGNGYMLISGLTEIVASVTDHIRRRELDYVAASSHIPHEKPRCSFPPLPFGMAYMANYHHPQPCSAHGSDFLSHDCLRGIFEYRAARLAFEASDILASTKLSKSAASNKHMMFSIVAARAHIETYVVTSFIQQVAVLPLSPIRTVLSKPASLYELTAIVSLTSIDTISFVANGHLSHAQFTDIRVLVDGLHEELLPDAIVLTGAWNFTDASMCSAIGKRDGIAYERVMEWTRQLPINVNAKKNGGVFKKGFDKHIEPVLRARLRSCQVV